MKGVVAARVVNYLPVGPVRLWHVLLLKHRLSLCSVLLWLQLLGDKIVAGARADRKWLQ